MLKNRKQLKDYSDEELYAFLEINEKIDLKELAGICSEILKRQIKGKFKLNSSEES